MFDASKKTHGSRRGAEFVIRRSVRSTSNESNMDLALGTIESESDRMEKYVRPLAAVLPETLPEKEGIDQREKITSRMIRRGSTEETN